MATIPLPALHVAPPAQQQDPLEAYARLQQLQNIPLQRQALQQSVQSGQLDIQQKQREMDSQNAIMQAWQDSGGDLGKAYQVAAKSGKALPGDLAKIQQANFQLQTQAMQLLNAKGERALQEGDMMAGAADTVKNAPPEARPAVYQQQIANLAKAGVDVSQVPPQYPGDQAFNALNLGIKSHKAALDQAAKEADARKANAQATEADANTQKIQAQTNPNSPLYSPSPAAVAMGTAPGAAQIQAGEAKQAGRRAAAEAAARQPYQLALQSQEQALRQGDPNAAGQLLVNGDATLSELKSRGATPDFIAKALNAAHQISGGKYNAQAADAQFDVAKSPTNVAFFGSAKSLTAPGGTLDQLAQAAKDLPGGKIPAFNSIADWERAATGNGPIAKYASVALGVADDYAKVMGGGQGSDTSRAQALNLIGAKQSPDQRAGSIEGIRGAVGSQIEHRIGSNPVLKRMYGENTGTGPGSGSSLSVTAPNGKTYTFKDQASADAFKQKAGIQ